MGVVPIDGWTLYGGFSSAVFRLLWRRSGVEFFLSPPEKIGYWIFNFTLVNGDILGIVVALFVNQHGAKIPRTLCSPNFPGVGAGH